MGYFEFSAYLEVSTQGKGEGFILFGFRFRTVFLVFIGFWLYRWLGVLMSSTTPMVDHKKRGVATCSTVSESTNTVLWTLLASACTANQLRLRTHWYDAHVAPRFSLVCVCYCCFEMCLSKLHLPICFALMFVHTRSSICCEQVCQSYLVNSRCGASSTRLLMWWRLRIRTKKNFARCEKRAKKLSRECLLMTFRL